MAKRLFDLVASCVGLIILLPLLLGIAAWVRLDSPGPAFFFQERIGRNGKPFRIIKFRSMSNKQGTTKDMLTVGSDSRITRAGHIIRRYKLDELPQLWNVVRGDMSLVGPRPEVPRYVAEYTEEERAVVLSVRPGMTDPASIEFADESRILGASADPERTYVDTILPRKIHLYREYVGHRSFLFDLMLIWRTIFVAMRPRS